MNKKTQTPNKRTLTPREAIAHEHGRTPTLAEIAEFGDQLIASARRSIERGIYEIRQGAYSHAPIGQLLYVESSTRASDFGHRTHDY